MYLRSGFTTPQYPKAGKKMDFFWNIVNLLVELCHHTPRWLVADLTIMAIIFPFALAVVMFARSECDRLHIILVVEKNPSATAKEVAEAIGLSEGRVSDLACQLRLEGKISENAVLK